MLEPLYLPPLTYRSTYMGAGATCQPWKRVTRAAHGSKGGQTWFAEYIECIIVNICAPPVGRAVDLVVLGRELYIQLDFVGWTIKGMEPPIISCLMYTTRHTIYSRALPAIAPSVQRTNDPELNIQQTLQP